LIEGEVAGICLIGRLRARQRPTLPIVSTIHGRRRIANNALSNDLLPSRQNRPCRFRCPWTRKCRSEGKGSSPRPYLTPNIRVGPPQRTLGFFPNIRQVQARRRSSAWGQRTD
jgi:hypothetical protein